MSEKTFLLLAHTFDQNHTMKSLDLSNITIPKSSIPALKILIDTLSAHELQSLEFTHNTQIIALHFIEIIKLFKALTKLAILDLSHNKFQNPALFQVVDTLYEMQSVESVDLSGNIIGVKVMHNMVNLISYHANLHNLILTKTIRSTSTLRILTEGLKTNSRIEYIDLSDHNFTPEDVQFISDMLCENTSIASLSLNHCRISNQGIKLLCDSLSRNATLHRISLQGNSFTNKGAMCILDMLEHNDTLKVIDISNNDLNEFIQKQIARILEGHNSNVNISQKNTTFLTTSNKIPDNGSQDFISKLEFLLYDCDAGLNDNICPLDQIFIQNSGLHNISMHPDQSDINLHDSAALDICNAD